MTDIVITPETFACLNRATAILDENHFLIERIEIRPNNYSSAGGARTYSIKAMNAFDYSGKIEALKHSPILIEIDATASALARCSITVHSATGDNDPEPLQMLYFTFEYSATQLDMALKAIKQYMTALQHFSFVDQITFCSADLDNSGTHDQPSND